MYKVAIYDGIIVDGLISKEIYEWGENIPDPHIILVRSHDIRQFSFPSHLLAVGRCGVGVNNIPVQQLTSHGIPVFNTPGANENAVKELVIAALLFTSRNLLNAHEFIENLKDIQRDRLSMFVEEHKRQLIGHELYGKTLGIIGLGHIGLNVAQIAPSLGLTVLGYDPYVKSHPSLSHVQVTNEIEQIFSQSDFVTLHVPLTQETTGLVDEHLLKLMKSNGILLNLSRGEVVNNDALRTVLMEKTAMRYLSDFPMADLLDLPQVILFPHIGGLTRESDHHSHQMMVHSITEYINHGHMIHAVNFPAVSLPRQSPFRLTLFGSHSNHFKDLESQLFFKGNVITNENLWEQKDLIYGIYDLREPLDGAFLSYIQQQEKFIKSRYLPLNDGTS